MMLISKAWNCLFHYYYLVIPKKGNHQTIAIISLASKVMLKTLQARLQHYENQELPEVQPRFRKGRGNRDQIAKQIKFTSIFDHRERKGISEKHLPVSSTTLKPLTVWITNCGKLLKRWGYQTILLIFWESNVGQEATVRTFYEQLFGSELRCMTGLSVATLFI